MRNKLAHVTKKELERLYLVEKHSSIELASIFDCQKSSILRKMNSFGIPKRSVAEALTGRKMPRETAEKISEWRKKNAHGHNHGSWKNGRIKAHGGHILVWVGDSHPYATAKGYVLEHRLVMEKIIGRYLLPREVVHHINGIPDDNRPENLFLCEDQSRHCAKHGGFVRKMSRS